MSDKLYTIGEFAAINKISTRMLRHYDKIGLLKPAAIADNNYRMYSSAQLPVAAYIKKYRTCAFSLEEIKLLLNNVENIKKLAQSKIEELKKQEELHTDALHRLYEMSDGKDYTHFDNAYEISLTTKESQLLLCTKHSCTEEQIESEFEQLYEFLKSANLKPAGLSMLINHISDNGSFRVAVPIKERVDTTSYTFEILDAGKYLSTFHYGDYDEITLAYDKLLLYIKQNNYKSDFSFLERYFLDSSHLVHPAQYITELSIRITP